MAVDKQIDDILTSAHVRHCMLASLAAATPRSDDGALRTTIKIALTTLAHLGFALTGSGAFTDSFALLNASARRIAGG